MKFSPLYCLFIVLLFASCGEDDDENLSPTVNELFFGTWVAEDVAASGTITTVTNFDGVERTTVAELDFAPNTLDFTLTFAEDGTYSTAGDYVLDADVDVTVNGQTSVAMREIEYSNIVNEGEFLAGRDLRLSLIKNLFTLRVDSRVLFNVNEPQIATYDLQGDVLVITRNQTTVFGSQSSMITNVSSSVSTWRKQ